MAVLITGCAGFIGSHTSQILLDRGERVIGLDNLNSYYDVGLKRARLRPLLDSAGFAFYEADVSDAKAVAAILGNHPEIDRIVHLAAQAGVRYSLEAPDTYVQSNLMGTTVLLEQTRRLDRLVNFVYASSSSVYGGNTKLPFSVGDTVDRPVSLYAATKRGTELIANVYSHLYGIPTVGLRYFTVYGPWGRPDMAAYIFCDAICKGHPIRVFNGGRMERDFTYVDDIVAGTVAALDRPPSPDRSGVRHRIYNLGNHRPESLLKFISILEQSLGREAMKQFEPMQPGDVTATYADIDESRRDLDFEPRIPLEVGLPRFVEWYRSYHSA